MKPFVLDRTDGMFSRCRKVSDRDVDLIRELKAAGIETKALATAFGIHPVQVNKINRRKAWKGYCCDNIES